MSLSPAVRFILLLGFVSLFADLTYEGARSILGPYLATLGASAFVVAVVSGAGEFAGQALRLISGYLADRTRRHWDLTLAGYFVNLLAVPLLALVPSWQTAALLVIAERLGKAIRTPPRDAMLAHAASVTGTGWGFGLHEAMDQIGAVAGPLLVMAVLALGGGYRQAFGWLLIPAAVALAVLILARRSFPQPEQLEIRRLTLASPGQARAFWWFLAAASLIGAGFVDYPLLAFHLERTAHFGGATVAALYAAAMAADAFSAVLLGRWFDRIGLPTLIAPALLTTLGATLAFSSNSRFVLLGVIFWGCALGAIESILRAAVANLVIPERRASAYGFFHAVFGASWFVGSALAGKAYAYGPEWVVAVVASLELSSLIFLWQAIRITHRGLR